MSAQKLVLTGVPGWLTTAFLEDLSASPLSHFSGVDAVVHPSFQSREPELRKQHPTLAGIHYFDLAVPHPFEKELEGAGAVLHSAGMIHVRHTSDWYRVNTDGTMALAECARGAGVRRFVFVSSNAAGGKSPSRDHLLSEADEPAPLSHYGRSKLLAEQRLMALHAPGRFEVAILRPSMFYGPPVPQRHIDVYRRILAGRMPLVGGGDFARSVTYIDNLVQACRLALTHPAASGETYYVVDRPVYTTRRISEEMANALGTTARFLPLPRIMAPLAYRTDCLLAACGVYWTNLHLVGEADWHVGISCEKAIHQLGYRPDVDLSEGMRRSVEWCRRMGKL